MGLNLRREGTLTRAGGRAAGHADSVKVNVVLTTCAATVEVLEHAAKLASGLQAEIRIVAPQIVPYPMQMPGRQAGAPLPDIQALASAAGIVGRIDVVFCRDDIAAIASILEPGSIVVMGGERTGWFSRVWRKARRLRRLGLDVVVVDTKARAPREIPFDST